MPTERRIVLAVADAAERQVLADRLGGSGFAVAPVGCATALPDVLKGADALVLDAALGAPDAAGWCAELRRGGLILPIVVLHEAGAGMVERCLDAGAQDGVAWPVRALELAARLRAQLRLHDDATDAAVPIGPYLFCAGRRELREPASGRLIRLTAIEAAMLRFLHRAGGASVPRPVLLHEVWGYQAGVATHTVETHIYRLRRKIEPDFNRRRLLLSDEVGYRLNLAGEHVAQDLAGPELRASA